MAPGGEMYRLYERFGENVLRHGSHEWLPYSKNAMRTKSPNTNLPCCRVILSIQPYSSRPRQLRTMASIRSILRSISLARAIWQRVLTRLCSG